MLNYNNSIIVILDGGLGNKFNGLFQGIYLSNLHHKNLIINNLRNHSTDFDLRLLFDFQFGYIENTLTELDRKLNPSIPLYAHRRDIKYNRDVFLNQSINNHDSFAFLTNSIQIPINHLNECYKRVKITSYIKNQLNSFITEKSIDKNTLGLHIRASDFPSRNSNIEFAKDFINKNQNKKIFVCTDEKEVELSLSVYSNLIFYPKLHYTEKYDKLGDWNGSIVDNDNRRWNYNATRNEPSMIEAFIEMLILSKTTINGNPKSSFLGWAKRFADSGLI
jgi:hypothetical protein